MLQLQNICKQYRMGELTQLALSNVSLNFRDSEFVSVLGPSGSGKTTLLNIIGGLDRYDAGNLLINGVPTQSYGDRDWDSYRNHAVGFVFQSYNLIPHQTVLENVELALKISGVPSSERRNRAQQALSEVGLADQMGKKPNQLSGGQMQRVAIARALVNNPAILLADEPTGALDTETSLQVMELLRNVARRRLVIMVTHNPDLAKRYSTRIVSLRDGRIVGDTRPCPNPRQDMPASQQQRPPKVGMGFGSSLTLSLKNLLTKKGRTALTAFAGSIGIIGIALIVAMSSSVNDYVADIQRDTMVSYPVTIESQSFNMNSLFAAAFSGESGDSDGGAETSGGDGSIDASYEDLEEQAQATLALKKNDLKSFKRYLDDPDSPIREHVGKNGITYTYDIPFDVYATDSNGALCDVNVIPDTKMTDDLNTASSPSSSGMTATMSEMRSQSFSELQMPAGETEPNVAIMENYDLAYGKWPTATDEMILVTGKDGTIPATLARRIGLLTQAQYDEVAKAIQEGRKPEAMSWSPEQLCPANLTLVSRFDRYVDAGNGRFSEVGSDDMSIRDLIQGHGLRIRIVGIARQKADSEVSLISTPFAYPPALTDALADNANASAPVMAQEANPDVSVLSGMPFGISDDAMKAEAVKGHLLGLGEEEKATTYMMLSYAHPEAFGSASPQAQAQGGTTADPTQATQTPGMATPLNDPATGIPTDGTGDAMAALQGMSATMLGTPQDAPSMALALDGWLNGNPDPQILIPMYDQLTGSETYESTLAKLGKVDKESPSSISIYADSFEDKDAIAKCIDEYNEGVEDQSQKIAYTDYIALITGSVTSIINIISYVLIAFVAVSLVVSCIMIGIITHISVLERTKEIGILRALGASRRNIAQVFNAETIIVGFLSGTLGVGVAAVLTIPITTVLHTALDSESISVTLPPLAALALVGVSILITLIGGIAPSRKAAWQDPVIALRAE